MCYHVALKFLHDFCKTHLMFLFVSMTSLQFGTMWTSYSRQHEQIQKAAGDRSGCKTWLCEEPQRLELLEKSVLTLRFFSWACIMVFLFGCNAATYVPSQRKFWRGFSAGFCEFLPRKKGVFQSLKTFFVFAILTITTSWAQCMDSDSQRVVGGYSLCGRCWDNRLHAHTWGVCISYGRNSFWNVALRQVMNLSFLDI